MRRWLPAAVAALALLGAAGTAPAGVSTHLYFGFGPYWDPYGPPHWYPYPYRYYSPYYPPPVVVMPPPAWVQPEPPRQPETYWYYCTSPEGYYPYVHACPPGWMKVVPQAPPASN